MKFKYGTRRRAIEYEKYWAEQWKKDQTFEKSVAKNPESEAYVFYDGPPFITGNPHYGTLLPSIVKDAMPRYQTMKGKRVERRWGWDCHGLPAENYVDKQLGITDRRDIGTKISLEKYITTARESMVQTGDSWESIIDRVGRWVDFKGAYKTMDKDFMESVWWAFKQLYEKGKIYEGEKVLMYDTKFATPISKNEVTMDNDAYQTVTDPSVYVKFRLTDESVDSSTREVDKPVYFLAWTTTPWTLPANMALAVNSAMDYIEVELDDEILILAKSLAEKVLVDEKHQPLKYEILHEFKGSRMVGKQYRRLLADEGNKVFVISGKYKFGAETGIKEIAENLKKDGYDVTVIHHTNPESPQYEDEIKALEKYDFAGANIITHSLGAPTFLSYLSRNDISVNSLTMIAPAYPGRNVNSRNPEWLKNSGYVGYELDLPEVAKKIKQGSTIIYSDNDEPGRRENAEDLGKELGSKMILEPGKKHFFGADYSFVPEYKMEDQSVFAKVYAADFVEDEGGTGVVHIAPAYGEDDFALAKKENISVKHVIDDNGFYYDDVAVSLEKLGVLPTDGDKIEVWTANKFIAKQLYEHGIVWKIDYIRHEYPFNPRSGQRIMYRAIPSWFFDVEGSKPLMLEQNENINWYPGHFKHGRFEKNIEAAPDWNLSRDRFWATAMPVWKGDKGSIKVIGSYAELKELSGVELEDYHRPWVDDITFEINGEKFTRVDKVLDCWFESGSMPFAQFHYPFENKEKFERSFPGDFIVEYVGQIRAWFYYLHVVNAALFGKNPFKNAIVTGTIAGNDGRKMSKSLGNFTDPNELMDQYSADSLRFLLLSGPLLSGEDFALKDKDVSDVARKLSMIWNMYDFFTMYAEVDGWDSDNLMLKDLGDLKNPLDIWIISRLHELKADITKNMDNYNIPDAMSGILPFIDDASNWFVRRSRRRFWKSDNDNDKDEAYSTLYTVLAKLAVLLAPFTPFLAEELYQKMVDGESVHLLNWPTNIKVDQKVLDDMARTREIITEGLAIRMDREDEYGQIKVRQPLASLTYAGEKLGEFYEQIIAEEVNVKFVEQGEKLTLDKVLTPELKREGQAREIIRFVQNARKDAGLNVDDRIVVNLTTSDSGLKQAIDEYRETIAIEILATKFENNDGFKTNVKIDGTELTIQLIKEEK